MAPCFLYFGCRGQAADFYYSDQWRRYQQDGILDRGKGLRIAFSRDSPIKRYVTHLMQEDSSHLWQLIQQVRRFLHINSCWPVNPLVLPSLAPSL